MPPDHSDAPQGLSRVDLGLCFNVVVPDAILLDPAIALHDLQDSIDLFFTLAFKIADLALHVVPICDYVLHCHFPFLFV